MNKYKVISDSNAAIKPRWIKSDSPASKQTRSEVRNIKKKDAQEIYRILNFFGVNHKIAEMCMLPPVAELRITLSYITQQTVISTSINLHQIIIIIMIIMSLQIL